MYIKRMGDQGKGSYIIFFAQKDCFSVFFTNFALSVGVLLTLKSATKVK